jgi:hypothetical protein
MDSLEQLNVDRRDSAMIAGFIVFLTGSTY